MQPMQPCDQFKDLHGELITAEHSALNLILSAQICKSATDQLIKALLKFLCHSDLSSRTEMKMVVQQNKGQSRDTAAALRWLSTQQNLLPACTFSGQGKITLSTLSWQNDRGSFNGFLRDHWSFSPSLISVLPAKGAIIGRTQTQIVFSWIDKTTKIPSLFILEPVNTL